MNANGVETTSKADQPRVTSEALRQEEKGPTLQYRVQRLGTYQERSPNRGSYGRMKR
jgi:hypothetical protein